MKENIMSKEAFNELIDGLEYVESLTEYGRKNIKYHVQKLQQENKQLRQDYAQIVSNNCDYLLLEQENKQLKERIDKAIELTNNFAFKILIDNRTMYIRLKDLEQGKDLLKLLEEVSE